MADQVSIGTAPKRPGDKRVLHEAAHKLGYWAPPGRNAHRTRAGVRGHPEAVRGAGRLPSAMSSRTPAAPCWRSARSGVVYGDIGTSPLYTEQVIFSPSRPPPTHARPPSTASSR